MRRWAVVSLAFLLGSCDAKVGSLCGRQVVQQVEPAAAPRPADVLFIVDNSCSMAQEQDALAQSFDRFIDQVAGVGKYRIGVVTTDQSLDPNDEGEMAGLVRFIHESEHPNEVVDIDRSQCFPVRPRQEHGCFRGSSAGSFIDSSRLNREQQISAFDRSVRVGTCGDGLEQPLAAMTSALNPRAGCNAGFRRDDANLILIFVADEDDGSPAEVMEYVDQLENRIDLTRLRVATVVGSAGGEAAFCRGTGETACGSVCRELDTPGSHLPCQVGEDEQCPDGEACQPQDQREGRCVEESPRGPTACASCSYYRTDDCCSAMPGQRLIAFAHEVERRVAEVDPNVVVSGCQGLNDNRPVCVIETICQEDFGDALARIALELVLSTTYDLNPPPRPSSQIWVSLLSGRFEGGEKPLEAGRDFILGPDRASITLIGEGVPEQDDSVRVVYFGPEDVRNTPSELDCLPN